MTTDELSLLEPQKLKKYFLSLVRRNRDADQDSQEAKDGGHIGDDSVLLSKTLSRSHDSDVRVELFLPPELAEKVDAALERWGSCPLTREHFFLSAALWALSSIEETDYLTAMGLDVNP
jgi:hypothetical protein